LLAPPGVVAALLSAALDELSGSVVANGWPVVIADVVGAL
jgi:hypothetical protein